MSKDVKKEEPMEKNVKNGNQHGEGSQSPHSQPSAKEKEVHTVHSFKWLCGNMKPLLITCSKAGTVENSLWTSKIFKDVHKKNKELVIISKERAISNHFPCCLIEKGDVLNVKYIKAAEKSEQPLGEAAQPQRKVSSDKLVTFHLATRGGKGIINDIMSNNELKNEVDQISVYAYKGETVKQALQRDGRVNEEIFKRNCVLSELGGDTEMSNPVDDLDGKIFKVKLVNNPCRSKRQPGSLDDDELLNEPQRSGADGNQGPPQQSTASESGNTQTTEERPMPNSRTTPETSPFHQIPEKMLNHLRSQFKDSVKQMKTQQKVSKLSDVQNLFRVEYGKNTQTCLEVKTVKRLMDLSKSVCQVRINRRAAGSGFLLFDKFVLTNGHVVGHIYNQERGQLRENVTVTFSFESLEQTDSCETVEVKTEVAAFEYHTDVSGYLCDWALLELCPDQALPDGLLKHFGFVPPSGGICIIGHPGEGVKKVDPCFIIPLEHRKQAVEKHYEENKECIQLVTDAFFNNRQVMSYDTCFFYWSSGSPVFDEHCNVVAMHSGGWPYPNANDQTQSVIEYAHPLSLIIEQIILKVVETGRFDILREFLTCEYPEHQEVMENVKKIVDGRNLTAFKNAADNLEVQNDERLKTFFEFFSLKEEPAPMDIN
ncbi:serine protease FAM111A-like [Centroberyx affinis]|uniref:serine protease FAM111A-like n=1 Tax=Centroberyx affinis TaxID=166261 RepID=UPI003A5C0A75